ncbi:unnamed protein product, partial [Musa banksii]
LPDPNQAATTPRPRLKKLLTVTGWLQSPDQLDATSDCCIM